MRPETPDEGLPLPAYVRARVADPDNPLKARARALGLVMVDREIIPPTRRAHQATEYARARGRLEPFHRAVLERYWSREENLNDVEVLKGAATDAGLDPAELERDLASGAWVAAVQRGLDEARALEIHAVPTFIVGGRFVIQGAQEATVLRHALERLGASPRS